MVTEISEQKGSIECDVVIIGSGVLGSALAATLARDGRQVTVIERDLKEPDRIVGELLQPGGCQALETLGLDGCLEGFDAHTIKGYVLHESKTKSKVHVPYPTDENGSTWGKAFHHGKFVMALRQAAMAEQNTHYIEGTVTSLLEENAITIGVEYKERSTGELKEVRAALTVVADGCFSKFRKNLVKQTPTVPSHFAGLVLKDCPQSIDNHAELVLMEPSPVLIYQISSNETRILIDMKAGMPANSKEYMRDTIAPKLPDHIQGPFLRALEVDRIRSMPNSWLPPVPIIKPGVVCLGDAVNMRHPLTGGGMSVAFNDVVLFHEYFKDIKNLHDYNAVMKAIKALYVSRKKQQSFVVNVMSMALYELFAADDAHLMRLKDACFAYFQLGGECVNGPVSLLSIMNPRPTVFLTHFFAVAMYAVYFQFKTEPWWALHRSLYSSAGILVKASRILLPLVWDELKTVVH